MPTWTPDQDAVASLAYALTRPPRGLYRKMLGEHVTNDTRQIIAEMLLDQLRLSGYRLVKDGEERARHSTPVIRK